MRGTGGEIFPGCRFAASGLRGKEEAVMKHLIGLAAVLALGASAPAGAQTADTFTNVRKIEIKGPKPTPAPATAAPAAAAKAQFGCDARAPNICRFRIFYARGSRDVVLPAGMKVAVPDVRIGSDSYCVDLNKNPRHKCARKTINAKYNS
jgi:hypothetical protein